MFINQYKNICYMRYLINISIAVLVLLTGIIINIVPAHGKSSNIQPMANSLLHVSYDPTRELYREYNELFNNFWFKYTGQHLTLNQSHGGSGKQARSVIDGLSADVVSLALAYDIDAIAQNSDLLPKNWQSRLPNASSPYTSTIVLLVRKGNPKKIYDWADIIKPNVKIVSPNPKTSGGARWGYLAAWTYALKTYKSDEAAYNFVAKIFNNVDVLDSGARGSLMTFTERGIGDVLISWENEAYLAAKKYGDKFDVIIPSISILAEPPVAIIDKVVDKRNSRILATAYLKYLYSEEAQRLVAKNFYRPFNAKVMHENAHIFKPTTLFKLKDVFLDWKTVHRTHFSNGAIFDKIMLQKYMQKTQ
jgi:sulfate/thiosulfate transport system substrate-binding protein